MALYELCKKFTVLKDEDIGYLEEIEKVMPLIADLTGSDIFIDVFNEDCSSAFVVAQAKPLFSSSLYDCSVVGMPAKRSDEPAVYKAVVSSLPVRDLRAVTQEGITVRQDVIPILHDERLIGVLIREKDISSDIRRDKKFDSMARHIESENVAVFPKLENADAITFQEVNHRVKNSLQLVTSILSIQARNSPTQEVRRIFEENVSRVLSIASTHDIIAHNEAYDKVSAFAVIEQVAQNLRSIASGTRIINIAVEGDDVIVGTDIASSIALVVNELAMNAIQYAFSDKEGGIVRISIQHGGLYSSITVEDNGGGFDAGSVMNGKHLGLRIARLTVQDKLHGELHINSSGKGTCAFFNFKMPAIN